MSTHRPMISVYSAEEEGKVVNSLVLPSVFCAPLRPDLVRFVFINLFKNKRQPYAVSPGAGYQSSAESWGTGRAVSRLPRVPGGGTHRAGQAAFANMCRGGGMFAPTKIWRRWHRKVNIKMKRHAVCSAIAATALTPLIMARGHRVEEVAEFPLVVSDEFQSYTKTRKAIAMLNTVGCGDDLEKVKASKSVRAGKGKHRNRKYTMRKGPLIIYNEDSGVTKAFRNIPGVELCDVKKLNVLLLAPGGTLGRLVVWSSSSFKYLAELYATVEGSETSKIKKGYHLHRPIMANPDLARLINSDEVQSVLNPMKKCSTIPRTLAKNPLTNFKAMCKLNPAYRKLRKLRLAQRDENSDSRKALKKRCKKLAVACREYQKKTKDYRKKVLLAFDDKAQLELARKEEERLKNLEHLKAMRGEVDKD